jgi:septal ring factor EnvC (AmiA/AmiB activator)
VEDGLSFSSAGSVRMKGRTWRDARWMALFSTAIPAAREGRSKRMVAGLGIVALLALLPAALLPAALLAQTAAQPSLAEQQAALRRATAEAQAARKRGEQFEARADRASAEADRMRERAAALAARIQQSEADLRAGQARVAIIAARQREQERRLAARRQPIAKLAAALQQLARRSPVLALVEPGTVSDAVHRRIVLARTLPLIQARTGALRAEIAHSAQLRRQARLATDALARTRANLVDQRARLAAAEQDLRLAAGRLRDNAGAQADQALAMGEAARDIGALLGQIEAAGSVRESLMALPGPSPRPAAPQDAALPAAPVARAAASAAPRPAGWRLPVVGDVVAGFGELSPSGVRARGLTIATVPAATVVAPADGRVAFAGPFEGYGQILIVEHGGGWTSLVAHLDRLTARVGAQLRAGDPVGSAARTQPRILVELRRGEEPVDIAALIG